MPGMKPLDAIKSQPTRQKIIEWRDKNNVSSSNGRRLEYVESAKRNTDEYKSVDDRDAKRHKP